MLKTNLERIRFLIGNSCKKASRDISEIVLLAVTKEADLGLIKEAIELGIRDFGENRIQDALRKLSLFKRDDIALHFIGHLQTNKAKDAVRIFKLIHSVDSLKIVEAINREASKIDKIQDVLLEVNIAKEASKFGLDKDDVADFLSSASNFESVKIKGLMTIAPLVKDKEEARPYFRTLKNLFENVKGLGFKNMEFKFLSMGMSQDFEIAIEEGANIIRIGTALFKG